MSDGQNSGKIPLRHGGSVEVMKGYTLVKIEGTEKGEKNRSNALYKVLSPFFGKHLAIKFDEEHPIYMGVLGKKITHSINPENPGWECLLHLGGGFWKSIRYKDSVRGIFVRELAPDESLLCRKTPDEIIKLREKIACEVEKMSHEVRTIPIEGCKRGSKKNELM